MITNSDKKKLGIYVHIPFCLKKCGYCDFLSFEDVPAPVHEKYVKALIKELESSVEIYGNYFIVDSIFIGGGTPSLLIPGIIYDVIQAVKSNFDVDADTEITVEANPKTLSGAKLESYLNAGINRLSLGVQSFDDIILEVLGRVHSSEDAVISFKMARKAGFKNINLDLMFGIPQQSVDTWGETIDAAIGLEPEHISFYSLQIEEETKFYEILEAGTYEKVSDELDREMYHYAIEKLRGAGYGHYEISNAAKSGCECRHNVKYWSMDDYLGVGLGAHSYIDGVRFGNIRDLEKYIGLNLENPREFCRVNSAGDDMSEYMFTGLRMMKGIDLGDFESRFKKPLKDAYKGEWPAIERYIDGGFLILDGGRLKLSEKGIDISNRIMSEFVYGG